MSRIDIYNMIVISDIASRDAYPGSICGMTVDVQPITALSRKPEIVVIDIDLRDLEKVSKLRRVLTDPPGVVAISVDMASHHARTQALALGATMLLPNPLTISDLEDLVTREKSPFQIDGECRQSVVGAATALEDSFAALEARSNLALHQIRRSSAEIVEAIAERGVASWLNTVRVTHKRTFQHCLLVTGIATAFGHGTGMGRTDIALLTITGLLHDIGKVRVPAEILDKVGSLTAEEVEVLRRHPVDGYDYLKAQGGVSTGIQSAVRHHHEYLDGSGYPDGLMNGQIDDLTRILTICDIYGAMIELRPYKPPMRPEDAIEALEYMAGQGKLEMVLVRALARVVNIG